MHCSQTHSQHDPPSPGPSLRTHTRKTPTNIHCTNTRPAQICIHPQVSINCVWSGNSTSVHCPCRAVFVQHVCRAVSDEHICHCLCVSVGWVELAGGGGKEFPSVALRTRRMVTRCCWLYSRRRHAVHPACLNMNFHVKCDRTYERTNTQSGATRCVEFICI